MDKFNEMAKDIDNKRMADKDKDVLELNRQKNHLKKLLRDTKSPKMKAFVSEQIEQCDKAIKMKQIDMFKPYRED